MRTQCAQRECTHSTTTRAHTPGLRNVTLMTDAPLESDRVRTTNLVSPTHTHQCITHHMQQSARTVRTPVSGAVFRNVSKCLSLSVISTCIGDRATSRRCALSSYTSADRQYTCVRAVRSHAHAGLTHYARPNTRTITHTHTLRERTVSTVR
jgi:hypothetical protein